MVQLSSDIIKEVSGFEDEELQNFIVYCNKNIKIKMCDTKTTLKQKVFFALEKYHSSKKLSKD